MSTAAKRWAEPGWSDVDRAGFVLLQLALRKYSPKLGRMDLIVEALAAARLDARRELLAELREPSDAMFHAGEDALDREAPFGNVTTSWQAMLDAYRNDGALAP